MADKKDAAPKPSERRPGEGSGAGPKRPYTTLDLKATEVSSGSTGNDKTKREKEQSGSAAKPSASPDASVNANSAEAAARIAAAAAAMRQGQARPATAGVHLTREQILTGDPPPHDSANSDRARSGASGLAGLGGHASHLAAAVVGGVIAIVGSQLLVSRTPPAEDTAVRELQQKLAALERSAKQQPGGQLPADAVQRLNAVEANLKQLDSLKGNVTSLQETQAQLAEQTKALQASAERRIVDNDAAGRLDKVEEQIAALSAAANADPQSAARMGQMAQITTRLADLESAADSRIATARKELSQEIESRIAPVAEASEAARTAVQRLDREMANVRSETTRIGQRVEVLRAGTDRLEQSVRALQGDASAANAALEKLRTDMDARLGSTAKIADLSSALAPVSDRIKALETGVQGIQSAEGERKANAERIVLSLELSNLKRAMDSGGAYAPELAAVKRTAGSRIDLAPLERYQHQGVPTEVELAREFRSVANAVLDADAEQPNASLVDRLLSGARTIVRVRKTSHPADDMSTEAIVGRMETALKENRLGDVLAEAKKLPAKAAGPAQDWLRKVEARQTVDAALARIDADLKAALGGSTPAAPAAKGARQ